MQELTPPAGGKLHNQYHDAHVGSIRWNLSMCMGVVRPGMQPLHPKGGDPGQACPGVAVPGRHLRLRGRLPGLQCHRCPLPPGCQSAPAGELLSIPHVWLRECQLEGEHGMTEMLCVGWHTQARLQSSMERLGSCPCASPRLKRRRTRALLGQASAGGLTQVVRCRMRSSAERASLSPLTIGS